jgi:hypothetical protein
MHRPGHLVSAADLRARIAEALMARIKAAIIINPGYSPGVVGQPFAATEYDLADVALAEVQAELDAQAAELARLTDRLEGCWEGEARANAAKDEKLKQAEAERDQFRDLLTEALHLHAYGERAPGGDETWRSWWLRTEQTLRAALDQAPAAEQDGGGQ